MGRKLRTVPSVITISLLLVVGNNSAVTGRLINLLRLGQCAVLMQYCTLKFFDLVPKYQACRNTDLINEGNREWHETRAKCLLHPSFVFTHLLATLLTQTLSGGRDDGTETLFFQFCTTLAFKRISTSCNFNRAY